MTITFLKLTIVCRQSKIMMNNVLMACFSYKIWV